MPRLPPFLLGVLLAPALPALPAMAQESGVIDRRDDTYLLDPEGLAVVGADGARIAEVEKVLVDQDGVPAGFVLELEGPFLLGGREIAVPLEALHYDANGYVSRMTLTQLENLPQWED